MVDILVIGATGYTGHLIVKYLSTHPDKSLFTLGIAARSKPKLDALRKKLSLPDSVQQYYVDVTDQGQVDELVQVAGVVVNAVGPYWTFGTPVLAACARLGKHYVDLTGEQHWVREMILQFDYIASKTHAILIPACGFDSVPSDLAVHLSNRTLKALASPTTSIASSLSAFSVSGALSGGTFSTFVTALEEVPRWKIRVSHREWALSTHLRGERRRERRLWWVLPFSRPQVWGGVWFMGAANRAIVQRTWGLNERAAKENPSQETQLRTYGPEFTYDEFMVTRNKFSAIVLSLSVALGFAAMLIPPIRWLVKKLMPAPGEGPSEEQLKTHRMEVTNVTSSVATPTSPATHVRTVIRAEVDPGYVLAAAFISESALSLHLHHSSLPSWVRQGGVLTPASAIGDVLVKRLEKSGLVQFESEVVVGGEADEDRKRR
ncbi:Saccharopine dehydrogenase-domain-containing protein [Irpex lacteus]|nr:Saccharopine dehydrogenase-domain-containing protein [Irpex lacteus]